MIMVKFTEEKRLWNKGFKRIVGIDEAGRGPLAGPVAAAAVLFNKSIDLKPFEKLRDSKKLSKKQRIHFYSLIIKNPKIEWGFARVSEKVIDKINILEATKLAMEKAVRNLETKKEKADFLILDGNININSKTRQKAIVKADEKVLSCMAASIIAKVKRDGIMESLDEKYPQYGFKKHKGYPTYHHVKMLKKHGPCKIHRRSFYPVKES